MREIEELSTFESVNKDIKKGLAEIDALVFAHYPYLDHQPMPQKNQALIALIDQLLELKGSIEDIKKSICSEIIYRSHIGHI